VETWSLLGIIESVFLSLSYDQSITAQVKAKLVTGIIIIIIIIIIIREEENQLNHEAMNYNKSRTLKIIE